MPAPIALVGAACRLPGGAHSLAAFTDHGRRALDPVGPAPEWRGFDALYDPVPGTPGRTPLRDGGFLTDDLRDFDPDFFGMNAREAGALDPQQRLLLQVAIEALHHAGTPPRAVDPARAGVFVGISGSEYKVLAQRRDPTWIDPYIGTGVHAGTAAGRLAYTFGWNGETLAVDTACSSGLVAFHLACRAIRDGRLDTALVAAVNVLLDPEANVSMAAMGTLSPSGRCRTFSSAADGYIRSEGAVAVLLRAAPRAQDRVLCWVLGTACNQDGHSNGLTAPNGLAQQVVIRAALADAGVTAAEVAYHEAHGSATRLGDAVELGAVAAVHAGRRDPLPLGSVKSRIGHLEAAAGLAGLLQAVGVLHTGQIPPSLHSEPANEALAEAPHLRVARAAEPLAGSVATVSSLGIGGTNAHVVLRAAERAPRPAADDVVHVLALSAPAEEGLDELIRRADGALAADERWTDLAATATAGRSAYPQRTAVVARSAAEARARLGSARRAAAWDERTVGFVYPGQGVGGPRMARALYDRDPVVRAAIDRCLAAAERVGLAAAWWGEDPRWVESMALIQPAVFAVSWALTERLRAWGVEPAAVAGHSSGEVAAACVAGVLSVEDAVDLLILRGEILDRTPPGRMAAVFASADAVLERLPRGPVGIAAENHPEETVISGPTEEMDEAIGALTAHGLVVRPLNLTRAGHSSLLDPHLAAVEAWVAAHPLQRPRLPLVSGATGERIDEAVTTGGYWARQLRDPVRFGAAARALKGLGIGVALDLGPHPVLAGAAPLAAPGLLGIGTLHRDQEDEEALQGALAELWLAGVPLDARAFPGHRVVDWPQVPYRPRRCWLSGLEEARRTARAAGLYTVAWRPAAPEARPASVLFEVPPGLDAAAAAGWAIERLKEPSTAVAPPSVAFRVDPADPAHAAVIGVARAALREVPALGCAVVLGDGAPIAGETVRDGQIARLAPLPVRGTFRTRGTWLVTGGRGALGQRFVAWLAERGAERVVAVGRHGEGPVVDVADREALARLLADLGPLTGVVHAAGVLRDAALHRIEPAQIDAVFAGKVRGAQHLTELLPPEVHLVLLSSFTSLVGGRGQAVYAAANAVLDDLAARRVAAGGRAISLNLGPWAGESMASGTLDRRLREGLPPMEPEAALAAIGAALTTREPQVAVVDLDPEVAAQVEDAPPILAELLGLGPALALHREEWAEHQVGGEVVVSAADRLVWAASAGPLAQITLPEALVVSGRATARVRRSADAVELRAEGRVTLRARPGERWEPVRWADLAESCTTPVDLDRLYASFVARGVVHGPAYRRLLGARSGPQGLVGELAAEGTGGQKLDAALALAGTYAEGDRPWLPASIDAAWLDRVEDARTVHLRAVRRDAERIVSDVVLYDAAGVPVGALRGHTLVRVQGASADDPVARVTQIVRRVLGLPADARLDPDRSLLDQGLDSIVAVELRNRLVGDGFVAPLHRVLGGASIRELAGAVERAPEPAPAPAARAEEDWGAYLTAGFIGAVFGAAAWAAYTTLAAAW